MINKLLMKLGLGDGSLNAEVDTRRKYVRYVGLQGEVEVAGQAYSLRDWSMGGVSFETLPDARIMAGDTVNLTLRFRFPNSVVTVTQGGRVTRTGRKGVGAEFTELSPEAKRDFGRVLDAVHAQGFLQSQVA
jgi:hypothetical protein